VVRKPSPPTVKNAHSDRTKGGPNWGSGQNPRGATKKKEKEPARGRTDDDGPQEGAKKPAETKRGKGATTPVYGKSGEKRETLDESPGQKRDPVGGFEKPMCAFGAEDRSRLEKGDEYAPGGREGKQVAQKVTL